MQDDPGKLEAWCELQKGDSISDAGQRDADGIMEGDGGKKGDGNKSKLQASHPQVYTAPIA